MESLVDRIQHSLMHPMEGIVQSPFYSDRSNELWANMYDFWCFSDGYWFEADFVFLQLVDDLGGE